MSRPPTLGKEGLHASAVKEHIAPRLGPLDISGPSMLLEQTLGKRIQLGQLRGSEPIFIGPVAVGEKGLHLLTDDGTQLANGKRHHQSAFVYVPFSHDSPNDFDLHTTISSSSDRKRSLKRVGVKVSPRLTISLLFQDLL